MVFAALLHYELPDILDYQREFVRADVRVGVDEYVRIRAEFHEEMEHLADIASFGRAGVELPVGERAGSALAVAVVGVRIHLPLTGKPGHVDFTRMHILAPFQYHRPETQRDEFERGEHARRPRTDHRDGLGPVYIREFRQRIRLIFVFRSIGLVSVAPHRLLAGVYGALLEHPFQASGLGLYLLEARFPRQRADYLEFFHRSNPDALETGATSSGVRSPAR